MLDSNITLFEFQQPPKQKQLDIHTFEFLQCPSHPGYGVEVFCPKENQEPALLCVKCILDQEISREIKGARLIAIRDIILKSIEKSLSCETQGFTSDVSEKLQQKYLEFNSRGYLGIFERHVDNQMDKLDKEIDKIKGSLQKLREGFAEFFEKQMDYLCKQNYNIKSLFSSHLEDINAMEKVSFNSLDALLHELSSINNFQDYQQFVKLLFRRSASADNNGIDIMVNKILNAMDTMRIQVSAMKSMKLDTRILEDLRDRIESINTLDKSITLANLGSLEPGLEVTLEKIRRIERRPENLEATRSTYPRVGSSKKNSPANGIIKKKPSTLDDIFNRKFGYERGGSLALKTPESSKKYFQNFISSDTRSKRRHSKDFSSLIGDPEAVVNLNSLIESTDNPLCNSYWYDSRPQLKPEFPYSLNGNNDPSGKKGLELHRNLKTSLLTVGEASNTLGYRKSYYEELKKERDMGAKNFEKAYDNSSLYDGSLRGTNKTYQALDSLQEHSKKAQISSHAYDTLIEDWVDENLNGFVVFQNTLKDNPMDITQDLNPSANQLWLQLSRAERDEYIAVALMARAKIKEELKKQNIPDLLQLQELVNKKISEVKKSL